MLLLKKMKKTKELNKSLNTEELFLISLHLQLNEPIFAAMFYYLIVVFKICMAAESFYPRKR
jgi:hypothetical protein